MVQSFGSFFKCHTFVSSGYLCIVSLGGMYQCEGGLGGKMMGSRTHLLKSPVYQYDGKTGNFD